MPKIIREHLDKILLAVFALNSLDALMTVVWLTMDIGEEANPLMDHVYNLGPQVFITTKVALVSLGSILLWRLRHRGTAVVFSLVALISYLGVAIWHLYNFAML